MILLLILSLLVAAAAPAAAADTSAEGEDLQAQLTDAFRRLQELEASRSLLSAELEAEYAFKEQLVQQLRERESELREVQAVVAVLQRERGSSAPPEADAPQPPAAR
jgi:chromosome segregation ATPase